MVSRFESTFRDRVIPAAERAFGVTVDFIFDDDSEISLTAMPDIENVPQSDDRYQKVEGTVTIQTALIPPRVAESDVPKRVRIRDEVYHVYGQSPSHAGLTVFNVRRKATEQAHTNMYDMNDQQAVWHEG